MTLSPLPHFCKSFSGSPPEICRMAYRPYVTCFFLQTFLLLLLLSPFAILTLYLCWANCSSLALRALDSGLDYPPCLHICCLVNGCSPFRTLGRLHFSPKVGLVASSEFSPSLGFPLILYIVIVYMCVPSGGGVISIQSPSTGSSMQEVSVGRGEGYL